MRIHSCVAAMAVISFFPVAFGISATARADVTSNESGQTEFVRVIAVSESGTIGTDSEIIRFEECLTASPNQCQRIGTRDYSVGELKAMHEKLLNDADDADSWNFLNVLEVIAGAIVGVIAGCIGGALIGVAAAGAGPFAGLAGLGAGCVIGAVAGGVGGGIGTYYWVKSVKDDNADNLRDDATAIDDVISGTPVSIPGDIGSFAKQLGEALSGLPDQQPGNNPNPPETNPQPPA